GDSAPRVRLYLRDLRRAGGGAGHSARRWCAARRRVARCNRRCTNHAAFVDARAGPKPNAACAFAAARLADLEPLGLEFRHPPRALAQRALRGHPRWFGATGREDLTRRFERTLRAMQRFLIVTPDDL